MFVNFGTDNPQTMTQEVFNRKLNSLKFGAMLSKGQIQSLVNRTNQDSGGLPFSSVDYNRALSHYNKIKDVIVPEYNDLVNAYPELSFSDSAKNAGRLIEQYLSEATALMNRAETIDTSSADSKFMSRPMIRQSDGVDRLLTQQSSNAPMPENFAPPGSSDPFAFLDKPQPDGTVQTSQPKESFFKKHQTSLLIAGAGAIAFYLTQMR